MRYFRHFSLFLATCNMQDMQEREMRDNRERKDTSENHRCSRDVIASSLDSNSDINCICFLYESH
jgi:hypothetical protein